VIERDEAFHLLLGIADQRGADFDLVRQQVRDRQWLNP
jgi:hypothetical protein